MGAAGVNARRLRPLDVHRRLRRRYGSPAWWRGTRFEVCVGAILTQNTAWSNVEKALDALRSRGRLSYRRLRGLPAARLAPLIRSSGTYNVKARRLAGFVAFLGREYGGRVGAMSREDPWELRAKLLAVPGIGRETADSIALYAAGVPLFVVDAYTRRVFSRLGLVGGHEPYDALQRFFMDNLPRDTALYSDYHAQIVRLAQTACRTRPLCGRCPLEGVCPKRGVAVTGGSR
jgi:endonuclease III related protein